MVILRKPDFVMEMLEMYSRDGNMAALAECHDFLPQMWNKNTVAAKFFN